MRPVEGDHIGQRPHRDWRGAVLQIFCKASLELGQQYLLLQRADLIVVEILDFVDVDQRRPLCLEHEKRRFERPIGAET